VKFSLTYSIACPTLYFYFFENYFVHPHKTERTYWLALVVRWNVRPGNVCAV
jgi:hypothetical protein